MIEIKHYNNNLQQLEWEHPGGPFKSNTEGTDVNKN